MSKCQLYVEQKLFASSSAVDTDITAKLIDVFPDCRAINLCVGILRLRYQDEVERDMENAWLTSVPEPAPLDDLLGHSITYRIAVGPRAGQKLFTLQTVLPRLKGLEGDPNGEARAGGVEQPDLPA
jgi:hypothetical protein